MYEYNICTCPDVKLFYKQCLALENNIHGLQSVDLLEDVDGSLLQIYQHPKGIVKVKNDIQVGALYVVSEFDLLPYFRHE